MKDSLPAKNNCVFTIYGSFQTTSRSAHSTPTPHYSPEPFSSDTQESAAPSSPCNLWEGSVLAAAASVGRDDLLSCIDLHCI